MPWSFPKASSLLVLTLSVATALSAQEFPIFLDADSGDTPAVAFNSTQDNWLVLAHDAGVLSMRRVGWNDDGGPWVGKLRSLDYVYAPSYAVAYNWESDNYLAVWTNGYKVLAARVDFRARRIDDPITLYSSASDILAVDVVYLGQRDRWLALWQKHVDAAPDPVLMRLVKGDGSLEGSVFDVGSGVDEWGEWTVDYSARDEQFLLVWEDGSGEWQDGLAGRFFLENGDTVGGVLDVGNGYSPAVVYGHKARRWLIVWRSWGDIESRLVVGGVLQPVQVLPLDFWELVFPAVAYNPLMRKFLVTWFGDRHKYISDEGIYGQWVREAGDPFRGTYLVTGCGAETWNEEYLACSVLEARCLVTWWQWGNEIWGRFVTDVRSLTVDRTGTGAGNVVSSPGGMHCGPWSGSYCTWSYLVGTVVELRAYPYSDSEFTGWGGHPDCADGVVTMSADRTCTAGFDYMPRLSVSRNGDGGGTVTSSPGGIGCGGDCEHRYSAGTLVRLDAAASVGSSFLGWSGHADCADGWVTLADDRHCEATFMLDRTLTVTKAGSGSGTVTSSPPGIDCGGACSAAYPWGSSVGLAAVPDLGSEFAGWGGHADCADAVVTMDADKTCTATFEPCSIASEVTVRDLVITGEETHQACNRLVVGPSVFVTATGRAHFRAGNTIEFVEPMSVDVGGEMDARIGPPVS